MPTLEIRYSDEEVQRLAERMRRTLARTNTKPLMEAVGEVVVARTMMRFERGVAPGGERWKQSLAALREGRPTLVKSGRLRDSLNSDSPNVTATNVEVGTNVEYADALQNGATIPAHVITPRNAKALRIPGIGFRRKVNHPGGTIEARPFLGIDDEDQRSILDITDTWIKQKLGIL